MKHTFDTSRLDIITPVKMEADWPTKEELVETLRYQKEHYGIRRFALGAPSIGWKSVGFPPLSHFEKLAELFSQVRDQVREDGISCGFLNMLTLRNGGREDFDKFICADGSVATVATCPLDPGFRKAFAEANARFSALAHPDFIIFEDEYSINAQNWGGLGCFCRHHMEEFNRRTGRDYSREELVSALREPTEEGYALLRKWRELTRDSLVSLSKAVRDEVDKLTPEIPIGFMQPSSADRDGDSTEAVARALAGPNHTPFSRIYGTIYCDIANAKHLPEILFHPLYSRQHILGDFLFYHESDTYPHTRFFLSAKKMRTIMASAYSMAYDGSTFQTVQILDDKNEEKAYGTMYKTECRRFNAARTAAKQCTVKGVQICYDPFWNTADGTGGRPYWCRSLGQFGIPVTTLDAPVAFWDRRQAKHVDHETVMRRLSMGLFLDGEAARILCQRGYGKYLGVTLGEPLVADHIVNDDASREIIRPPFDGFSRGTHMWPSNQDAANRGRYMLEMQCTDPKTEIITELVSFRQEVVSVGMTRFENELGGKIVVLAQPIEKNLSGSLLNYRRQRLFHALVQWCSDSWVYVKNEPNVYIIMNEANEPEKSGFLGMLTLSNLGEDPVENLVLHLPPKWQSAKPFRILDREGQWVPGNFERARDTLTVTDELGHCDPMYILVE